MTTPKEALERARTAINAIVLSTHSVSFKADLDVIDEALASLQGEDAVERVARIVDPEAFEDDRLTWEDRRVRALNRARRILATGPCAKANDLVEACEEIAAAIRSGGAK